jgi:hypothetical protein
MAQTKQDLLDQLVSTAQSLSTDKLLEAVDFVGYLRDKEARPERGSAQALLSHVGAFPFGPGELAQLLADIDDHIDAQRHSG